MRIDIVTLFPEMCETVLHESIIGRARKNNLITLYCHNIRDYTLNKHRRVDDYPYGGGQGMIIGPEPIARCFDSIIAQTGEKPHFVYMSPQGERFSQEKAKEYSKLNNLVILCGHYEGIDERIIEEYIDEEISIGDFVLTGGELPALCIADAVARMIPGVLSEDICFEDESHYSGVLEHPQYTRPPVWRGREVPQVLLSGHHANIKKWCRKMSLLRTCQRRPDMFKRLELTKEDKKLLSED